MADPSIRRRRHCHRHCIDLVGVTHGSSPSPTKTASGGSCGLRLKNELGIRGDGGF